MKKIILSLVAILMVTVNANALSKSRSRDEARFLTDKMAYELDLTDEQLQDIYEINYDYFRSLGPVTGNYDMEYDLRYRNLGYVLYDWQWNEFLLCDYFLRPVYIYHGGWAFGVYNYYVRTHWCFHNHHWHNYHGGHHMHHNYYLSRRDMHHRAVINRGTRANIHERRPQMLRPNVGHNNGISNRRNNGISHNNGNGNGNGQYSRPENRGNNTPSHNNNGVRQESRVNRSNGRVINGQSQIKSNNNVTRTPRQSSRSNQVTRSTSAPSRSVTRSSAAPSRSNGSVSRGGMSRSGGHSNGGGRNGGRGHN